MTTLTDFAPDDLAILNRTPTSVAMGAAYADQDGAFSLPKEMQAGLTAAREAAFAFPDNEIIQLLAESMQDVDEDDDAEPERSAEHKIRARNASRRHTFTWMIFAGGKPLK